MIALVDPVASFLSSVGFYVSFVEKLNSVKPSGGHWSVRPLWSGRTGHRKGNPKARIA